MKTKSKFSVLAVLLLAILTIAGCQRNPPTPTPTPTPVPATVTMDNSYNLTMSGVTVDFKVVPNDSKISQSGVAYSTGNTASSATKVAADAKSGTITVSLDGLNINTKYNIWAYVTTAKGTFYTKSIQIWTYGLMDIDGNGYHTVKIGNQTWTVENLKVTHYRNGDLIPEIQDSTTWLHDTKGARCYYHNNKAKYDSVYGALYNFYAVNDPRGIAPKGWHVPTLQEYNKLSIFLGKNPVAGGKMKEKGTKHWKAPNTGATNSSGFTALPGGMRGLTIQHKTVISFAGLGGYAYVWTSSKSPVPNSALLMNLKYNDVWLDIGDSSEDNAAFSIRLVKNK